jgi:SAM-dependent methyltransferase
MVASCCCPSCLCSALSDRGALPALHAYAFAGGERVMVDPGRLLECGGCGLHFRYPALFSRRALHLYEKAPETSWQYAQRQEWPLIARWLHRYSPNHHLLDVGCFRGDFLHWMGEAWERAGIEPSEAARGIALGRGIDLIAHSILEVDGHEPRFGAVTLLDVLEHFHNPLDVMARAAGLLVPRGILVVYTATTDAWAWRLIGSKYWYCSFPEHLSFINARWLTWACQTLGLAILEKRQLSHGGGGLPARMRDGCRAFAFWSTRRHSESDLLYRLMRSIPILGRTADWTSGPMCHNLKDHLLVAFTPKR